MKILSTGQHLRILFIKILFFNILITIITTFLLTGMISCTRTDTAGLQNSTVTSETTEKSFGDSDNSDDISFSERASNSSDTASENNITGSDIIIGIEYASPGLAKVFSEIGIPAVKQFPESMSWEKMQKSPESSIDFSVTDRFVKEYQEAGFTELFLTLRSKNNWASKNPLNNHSPKDEYMDLYREWTRAIAERYDCDGIDDMPGLIKPVIYYEIGSEFSTYEPEPVENYIEMLKAAYESIHSASNDAVVLHVPFLTTTVFKDYPDSSEYEKVFNQTDKRIMFHSLREIRKILDNYQYFDAVNIHSLGSAYEIEENVKWLNYEMDQRGFKKPVIISDTAVNPFIGWGSATECESKIGIKLGIVIYPASENDRCRLAEYFKKLIGGDEIYLEWVRAFCAGDVAKMVIVAAEQKIWLINTAFMEEIALAQTELFQAAAGNTSWSGMTKTKMNFVKNEHEAVEIYPSFYALKQLAGHIEGYDSIMRITVAEGEPDNKSGGTGNGKDNAASIRLYRVDKQNSYFFIVWFEPDYLVLPDDPVPQMKLNVEIGSQKAVLERLITGIGQVNPETETVQTDNDGVIEVNITNMPLFIFPQDD